MHVTAGVGGAATFTVGVTPIYLYSLVCDFFLIHLRVIESSPNTHNFTPSTVTQPPIPSPSHLALH